MTAKRNPRDGGFTLVELLVVVLLLGIVGGVVTSSIVSALSSARSTTARVHALNELEIAMQRVLGDLRAAEQFVWSGSGDFDTEFGVVVSVDGVPRTINYLLVEADDGQQALVREDTGQTLVTLVGNEEDEAVFRYLDQFGNELNCNDPPECNDYKASAALEVRLVRGIEGSEPVMIESRVSVRNVRYGGVS